MARDDNYDDELPPDNMAGLANGMIIITTILLALAVFAMYKLSADMYGVGLLGSN